MVWRTRVFQSSVRRAWRASTLGSVEAPGEGCIKAAKEFLTCRLYMAQANDHELRTRLPNHTVRNVWRASAAKQLRTLLIITVSANIYKDLYDVAHTSFPNHTVRNVWRESALGCVEPQASVCTTGQPRLATNAGPAPADGRVGCRRRPEMPSGLCLRGPPIGYLPSAGGIHMKSADGIGREAGFGITRNVKELNVLRACPW